MTPSVTDYDDLTKLKYYQPFYVTPFLVSINPYYSKLMEKFCCEWAIKNGGVLSEDSSYRLAIERSDVGLFSAVCYVKATRHRLEKLLKWGQMLFISDDYHSLIQNSNKQTEDVSSFWNDFLDALELLEHGIKTPKSKWSDFIRGTHEVILEIYSDFDAYQIRRSVRMIGRYIRGSIEESTWDKDIIPTWKEYCHVRSRTVGIDMCMQLIEYSQNIILTDEEFFHPLMTKLFETISEELFLINDLLTFRKEVAESNYRFSQMKHSFTVLVAEGKTLQEAVDWVHGRILECDQLINEQIIKLLHDNSLIIIDKECQKKFEQFFIGVRYFIGGYWRHAITARRYHGINFSGALPPEGHFEYSKDQTILVPTRRHFIYDWFLPIS